MPAAAAYGPALCEDPRRVEALLRDLCGGGRKEIFILVGALRERVTVDLLGWPPGVPRELLLARLAGRLAADLGFAPQIARWAVETWALALARSPPGGQPPGPGPAPSDVAPGVLAPSDLALVTAPGVPLDGGDRASRWLEDGHLSRLGAAPRGVVRVALEPGATDFTSIGAAIQA